MHERKTIGVWLLIACHLLIVLPLAWYLNIWPDEASSLYSTESITFAFRHSASIERQAPFYFWILALWRSIDGSVFFARLLSVVCSVAAIWLFSGLAGRVLKTYRAAMLATAFFALHPVLIWVSCETQVYAVVILVSVVLMRSFFSVFFADERAADGLKRKVLFVVLAIIALYTNYYLGFLLAALFAALAVTRKWRPAIQYLGAMMITAAAASPLCFILAPHFAANPPDIGDDPSLSAGIRHIGGHVLTFILPADIRLSHEPADVGVVRLWVVGILLAATAVIGLIRWRRISPITIGLGVACATLFGGLLTAYLFVGISLVELRHAYVLFAALTLFVASLIQNIYGSDKDSGAFKYLATLAGVVALWFFWYAVSGMYPNLSKDGDWTRVATYIERHEKPNQPIIIFQTHDSLVMPYAYHGVNRVLPDERFFDFDLGVPTTPDGVKERTEFTISQIPGDASEIWLITNDECMRPAACQQFEQFLNENFVVVDQRAFYRNKVTLLRRRASPAVNSE